MKSVKIKRQARRKFYLFQRESISKSNMIIVYIKKRIKSMFTEALILCVLTIEDFSTISLLDR